MGVNRNKTVLWGIESPEGTRYIDSICQLNYYVLRYFGECNLLFLYPVLNYNSLCFII